jgi:hypothetical protein
MQHGLHAYAVVAAPEHPNVSLAAVYVMAQINAHLYLPSTGPQQQQQHVWPSDPGCYSLDVLCGYNLLLGSGGVVDEVEEMIMGLTTGGAAQRRWCAPGAG